MFKFDRERIMPYFLKQKMTVGELARKAGIAHTSAQRAIEGEKVAASIIAKVADTLGFDPMDFLEARKSMVKDFTQPQAKKFLQCIKAKMNEIIAKTEIEGYILSDIFDCGGNSVILKFELMKEV